MSFLQSRFSFLLVCGIQLIPQTLLQGAGVDAATLDSFTTQTSCLAAPASSDESNKSFAFKSPSLTSLEKKRASFVNRRLRDWPTSSFLYVLPF